MRVFKFVVVDDAIFMRNLLKKIIQERENYQVIAEGQNGLEAIELAKKYQPDIMTLDITMPEMDGIHAIKGILEVSPKTAIVMVSAMGQQSRIIEAVKLGARELIVKPFEKSSVLRAMDNISAGID